MADVSINIVGTTERNGSVVVGAPRGAGAAALGSKYTLLPGDDSDMESKGAVGGINDAPDVTVWDTKLTNRFDEHYGGGAATWPGSTS